MRNEENRSLDREDKMKYGYLRRTRLAAAANRVGGSLAVLLLGVGLISCDTLDRALSVEAPENVDAEDLKDPLNARFLVTGTIADFECALGAYIVNAGMLGNELRDAAVTASRFSLDRRDFTATDPFGVNSCEGSPPGIYVPLSTARATADTALIRLDAWTDQEVNDRTELIAQAAAYGGYSYVLMGEGFCTTVIEELGPEVQPEDAFTKAVARFDRAIEEARAVGDAETENMALLGRARAQLNLGSLAEAAEDARAVLANDPEFVKEATVSSGTGRRYNRVGNEFWLGRITVDLSYRDQTIDGQPDPRVEVIDTEELGGDSETPIWMATKYGSEYGTSLRETPLPIATWREAHLIIAEAEGGQEAVDRINILRDQAGLPQFSSNDNAEIQEQVIEERRRELFLEGHNLNDLRRFELPFVPAQGEPYRQGGTYGPNTCFMLPQLERDNNPNVS